MSVISCVWKKESIAFIEHWTVYNCGDMCSGYSTTERLRVKFGKSEGLAAGNKSMSLLLHHRDDYFFNQICTLKKMFWFFSGPSWALWKFGWWFCGETLIENIYSEVLTFCMLPSSPVALLSSLLWKCQFRCCIKLLLLVSSIYHFELALIDLSDPLRVENTALTY